MRKNKLRELLNKEEPTVGTHILVTWPGIAELIGYSDVIDYAEFESTYAPYHLYALDNLARATELVGISSMIKIDQEPRTYLAEKALQSGIQSILFADIRTIEDAKEAVRAVRCEPEGINGVGMFRTVEYVWSKSSVADFVKSCDDAVVALMIEKKSAVDNLEEILSIRGVDMVQFGPWDYSLSIGLSGLPGTAFALNHPKVKEAELKVIKAALKKDIRPRVEISNVKDAKQYIDLGVRDFCIGTDVSILYNWWRDNGGALRKILDNS